jgi:D-alanyl-D-alanine dipeptidase
MPSPTEPVNQLRHIPIVECGEPLVEFLEVCPELVWLEPRMNYTRARFARKSLAEMLCHAARLLPPGVRLGIQECWRPLHIQHRMQISVRARLRKHNPDWSETKLVRTMNKLSAPLHKKVPPPHSTGGAVDLWLVDEAGRRLDHTSPFHPYDPLCYDADASGISEEARRVRAMMRAALEPTGLTNYPSEYWHWSFGDQGWAYRGGHPHALYGSVVPPGYEPTPEDVNDDPLIFHDMT